MNSKQRRTHRRRYLCEKGEVPPKRILKKVRDWVDVHVGQADFASMPIDLQKYLPVRKDAVMLDVESVKKWLELFEAAQIDYQKGGKYGH